MLTLRLIAVSHGSAWASDVDMDTMCPLELDVCGSSSGRTVSLPSITIMLACVWRFTWTFYLFLWCQIQWYICCVCFIVCRHYMVAIPAVLEAGADTRFCASLMQPNETLTMIVNLISQRENRTLLERTSNTEFHECVHFKVSSQDLLLFFAHFQNSLWKWVN